MYGNDLCVADIPGVLVFAVNHRRERVPLNAQIMIPHTRLQVRPTPTLTRTRTRTRTRTLTLTLALTLALALTLTR